MLIIQKKNRFIRIITKTKQIGSLPVQFSPNAITFNSADSFTYLHIYKWHVYIAVVFMLQSFFN